MLKRILYLLTLSVFGFQTAFSQELDAELYEFSLEELLNMDVTSASKSEERLTDAPSIISTIPRQEFMRYGARNVLDIIERTTSVFITGSYFIPDNYISMRGDASSEYNRHILILINGRPTRETLTGGVDFSVLKAIPVSSIDKIEVIRGPGSVLYGSNAYTGVINIIIGGENKGFSGFANAGTFNSKSLDLSNSTTRGDLNVTTGLKYFRNDGWDNEITTELNELVSRKFASNGIGANVVGNYKNLSFTSFVTHSSQNNFGIFPTEAFPNATPFLNRDITSTRFMLDFGYKADISDTWRLEANTTFNESLLSYDAEGGDFEGESSDALLEVTNFFQLGEKTKLTLGGTAYLISAGGELADSPEFGVAYTDQTWYSTYFQAEYKPVDKLKLVAGAQLNAPEGVDAALVPRLGAIYNFSDKLGVKALYGEAFRTAYISEGQVNEPPRITGNPDLVPETVSTLDFQLFYNGADTWLSATYFQSSMQDLISLTAPPNQTYVNGNQIDFQGVEIEGKTLLAGRIFLNGSYSYQVNENEEGVENVTHMPQHLGKLGLSYKSRLVDLGVFNMFAGSISPVSDVNSAAREVNPTPENFNLLSVNMNFDIADLLDIGSENELFLNVTVNNLLDEEIYNPEFIRRNINSIRGRAGRTIDVGVNFKF